MKILAKAITGSRLYGTHTEDSDVDERFIVLPPLEQLMFGSLKTNHSVKDGKDVSYIPIQLLIKQLLEGKLGAIEILYGLEGEGQPTTLHDIWLERKRFLTKKTLKQMGQPRQVLSKLINGQLVWLKDVYHAIRICIACEDILRDEYLPTLSPERINLLMKFKQAPEFTKGMVEMASIIIESSIKKIERLELLSDLPDDIVNKTQFEKRMAEMVLIEYGRYECAR